MDQSICNDITTDMLETSIINKKTTKTTKSGQINAPYAILLKWEKLKTNHPTVKVPISSLNVKPLLATESTYLTSNPLLRKY